MAFIIRYIFKKKGNGAEGKFAFKFQMLIL